MAYPVSSGASLALPTVSALTCAQNATHSSQMNTQGDIPRLLHPPSMRFRTSRTANE